jgi:cysteine synthase A
MIESTSAAAGFRRRIVAGTKQVRDSVLQAIGNTPVVRLRKIVLPSMGEVLVKLEYYNPTGSYKDRMALAMIEGAEARGELRPGMARG